MVQPYNPEQVTPQDVAPEASQEAGNKEVDDLKKLIDGKNLDEINSKLNDNFLENLKNGLHPDTAKDLKTAIEGITGYDVEGSNLNQLYKYVISICDAFDTPENKDNDHDKIETSFNTSEFLTDQIKLRINGAIMAIEYLNIVVNDDSVQGILSATKGILNGEKLSGGVIVKMAEFLGISTRENDNKYNKQRRLNKLGKKVFELDSDKGLFKWLSNKYDEMKKDPKVKEFTENPLANFSLTDMCKNLIKMDWDGGDVSKDNEKIQRFCNNRGINIDGFVSQFNEKNTERINNNKEGLKKIDITTKFDVSKAEIDENNVLMYDQDGTKVLLNIDKLIQLTSETLNAGDVEGGNFVSDTELQNTMKDESVTAEWLGQIKKAIEARKPEPPEQTDTTEETPEIAALTEGDIDSNIRFFNKISAAKLVETINEATGKLGDLEEADKTKYTENIKKVIEALKTAGERVHGTGSKSIENLQHTMNEALNLSKPLVEDGKLGKNTFFAIKEYIGIATKGDRLRYDVPKGRVSDGLQPKYDTFDDLDPSEQESVEAQIRSPRERLNYLVSNNNFPGKDIISKITHNGDELKAIQLKLVPYYNTQRGIIQIDGKLGGRTLSALENYISENSGKSGDKIVLSDKTYGYEDNAGNLKCVLRSGRAYFDNFNGGNGLKYSKTKDGSISVEINGTQYAYGGVINKGLRKRVEDSENQENSGWSPVSDADDIARHLKMISEAKTIGNQVASAEQPAEKPAEQPTEQPAEKPAEQPTEQPAEQPTEQPAEQPAEKPAEQPTEQPAEKPAEQPTEQPAEQPAEKPAEQPAEQPTEQPAEKPAEQPTEQPAEKPAEQPAEKPAEQPTEQPAEKPAEQPAEKPAEKSV